MCWLFTVKHDNSYKSMDCTSVLIKNTFSGSDVARKFCSGRTKTESIVNSVLAPHTVNAALKELEANDIAYCGVATDGNNHRSTKINTVFQLEERWLAVKINQVYNTKNETA